MLGFGLVVAMVVGALLLALVLLGGLCFVVMLLAGSWESYAPLDDDGI